jgi:hypothetical protein
MDFDEILINLISRLMFYMIFELSSTNFIKKVTQCTEIIDM